ncbi:MAG: DUF3500 domain-containing protein [Planctomycetaceae bacterium]
MLRRLSITYSLCGICAVLAITLAMRAGDAPGLQMQTFATAWIATLDEAQKAKALVPYDSKERVTWNFIPLPTRKGLPLMEMNAAQQAGALRTLRAALSDAGYDKASKIMQNEAVLRLLEGAGSEEKRNPEKYYTAIYGTPADKGVWGFSFEGHHLSLNFVCRDGVVVDSTPQFFASNPATFQSETGGPLPKGTRILRLEEELAFDLVNRLPERQRGTAIIADKAPAEIRFASLPQPEQLPPEGIAMSELDAESQAILMQLIEVYVNAVPESIAKDRLEIVNGDGPSGIHFAWAGATKPGVGHYYRIQGKSFLVEFVNTQPDAEGNPANHIHAVYRDMTGDFDLPIGG